ncbi:MAG: ABC transporter ATP-binding protein [Candidatus Thermoplasmatota archaeon]|nr:ABC transporter ATP-binding protein [Candidatus Thermoplasmatota archaeon]
MNSSHDSMITVQGLTKEYGTQTALDTISFQVRKGEVFGFLGPNGAGKTTTIKAILGLIKYKQGAIALNGLDIVKQGKLAREVVGYLPERVAMYANLTAIQNLQFFSELKKVSEVDFDGLLVEYGLGDVGKKKIREFSKGMVQRLGMAQAILGSPKLLILDEPSGGLDPRGVRLIREKIRAVKKMEQLCFFHHIF